MIRDKVVFSIKEKPLKERLLREENLTLVWTKDLCRAFEITQNEIRTMAGAVSSPAEVENKTLHMFRKQKQQHNKGGASQWFILSWKQAH
jgi:hypothetical protein